MCLSKNNKIFYGWIVVIAAWLIYFSNVGLILYGTSILNARMISATNFNEAAIGIAFSLCTAFQGITSPISGLIIRKKGIKLSFIIGSLILVISSILIAKFTINEKYFIVFYGILVGSGMGLAGILTCQSTVNYWFNRQKSIAMAIVLSAGGLSGFVAPQIFEYIISLGNWKTGWYFIAANCTLSLIISIFVIVNKPENIGQIPDGREKNYIDLDNKKVEDSNNTTLKVAQVFKMPSLYLLIYCNATRLALYYACIGHIVIYLVRNGIEYYVAAFVISIISITSLIGRFAAGFTSDKILKSNTILAISNIIMAVGMILFNNISSIAFIYFSAILFGFGLGIGYVSQPLIISNYYGSNNFPIVNGVIYPINYIAASIGPIAAGFVASMTGSYSIAFGIMSALSISGGIVLFFIKPLEFLQMRELKTEK